MIIEAPGHHAVPRHDYSTRRARRLALMLIVLPGPAAILLPLIALSLVGRHTAAIPSPSPFGIAWVFTCGAICLVAMWWCLSSSLITWSLVYGGGRALPWHFRWLAPRILVRCVATVLGINVAFSPVPAEATPPVHAAESTTSELHVQGIAAARPSPLFETARGTSSAVSRLTPYFQPLGGAAAPSGPTASQADTRHRTRTDRESKPSPSTQAWVVNPDESLWSISQKLLGPDASPSTIQRTMVRIEALNRPVLADHPDLIYAGTRLSVPEEPNLSGSTGAS